MDGFRQQQIEEVCFRRAKRETFYSSGTKKPVDNFHRKPRGHCFIEYDQTFHCL